MTDAARKTSLSRKTLETEIQLELSLDGTGAAQVFTGIGFFDHMLKTLVRHAAFDLQLSARGDLEVDAHHTVEDVGIVLGQALAEALGEKRGIRRFGSATVPMEEALVTAAVDLSGRPFLVWCVAFPTERVGEFPLELMEEFWRAFSNNAGLNLHVLLHHGRNSHHIAEAVFKATARALRQAVDLDPRIRDIPSTKGTLS